MDTPAGEEEERVISKVKRSNRITNRFRELADAVGLTDVTPYTLRRTARTEAAHSTDDNAARRMMGQRLVGRDQTYIKQPFPLARLKALSLVIHARVFRRKKKPLPANPQVEAEKHDGDRD